MGGKDETVKKKGKSSLRSQEGVTIGDKDHVNESELLLDGEQLHFLVFVDKSRVSLSSKRPC